MTKKLRYFSKIIFPVITVILLVISGLVLAIQKNIFRSIDQFATSDFTNFKDDFKIDHVLPDFSLTDMQGKIHRISEMNKNLLFINFWASWCESCVEEMPSIVKLRERYKDQGFEVVGVNLDENPEKDVLPIVQHFHIQFPIYKDPEGKVAELFEVHAIPLSVIINKKRQILLIKDGQEDWDSPSVHLQVERWLAE